MDNATPKPTTNALADELELDAHERRRYFDGHETAKDKRSVELSRLAAAALRMPTIPAEDAALVRELRELGCDFQANASAGVLGFIVEETQQRATLCNDAAGRIEALAAENTRLHDALDKVCNDWAEEMQARVSPPVSRIAAEAQELREGWTHDEGWPKPLLIEAALRIEALAAEKHRDEQRIAAALRIVGDESGWRGSTLAAEIRAALTKRGASE